MRRRTKDSAPKHLKDDGDPTRRQLIRIYQAYEEACQRGGVVDFAELLLRAYELWDDNPGSAVSTIARAFATCWSTSFRIRMPSSTSG